MKTLTNKKKRFKHEGTRFTAMRLQSAETDLWDNAIVITRSFNLGIYAKMNNIAFGCPSVKTHTVEMWNVKKRKIIGNVEYDAALKQYVVNYAERQFILRSPQSIINALEAK
jgi:hypothetical protein